MRSIDCFVRSIGQVGVHATTGRGYTRSIDRGAQADRLTLGTLLPDRSSRGVKGGGAYINSSHESAESS